MLLQARIRGFIVCGDGEKFCGVRAVRLFAPFGSLLCLILALAMIPCGFSVCLYYALLRNACGSYRPKQLKKQGSMEHRQPVVGGGASGAQKETEGLGMRFQEKVRKRLEFPLGTAWKSTVSMSPVEV